MGILIISCLISDYIAFYLIKNCEEREKMFINLWYFTSVWMSGESLTSIDSFLEFIVELTFDSIFQHLQRQNVISIYSKNR